VVVLVLAWRDLLVHSYLGSFLFFLLRFLVSCLLLTFEAAGLPRHWVPWTGHICSAYLGPAGPTTWSGSRGEWHRHSSDPAPNLSLRWARTTVLARKREEPPSPVLSFKGSLRGRPIEEPTHGTTGLCVLSA